MFKNSAQVRKALPRTGELKSGVLATGGLNARDAYMDMRPNDAIAMRNVISSSYGVQVRRGYQEWAANLPNNMPVPTIMSYYPASAGVSGIAPLKYPSKRAQLADQSPYRIAIEDVNISGTLFACTNLSIYNVTSGGEGPWTPEGGVGTLTSDYWIWRNYQNAGGNFLLATNYDGAYVIYGGAGFDSGFSNGFSTEGTGFTRVEAGTTPAHIQNVDPDLFAYVSVWKGRVWFAEINSSRAWYLPPGQVTGEAHAFDFGPQFRHGGHLVAIVNWTIDGGEGIDDYLVAFSSEGDVVIYKGYDPDSAGEDPDAFQLHGIWYVGPLPPGRRQVDPYGGDVYVLSVMGVKQISKLVVATGIEEQSVNNISAKIDPLLNAVMNQLPDSQEYYLKALPNENALVVGNPETLSGEGLSQYYYAIPKAAWSALHDLPVLFWATHDHLTFAGTDRTGSELGGVVYIMFENALDDVKLNPLAPDAAGLFIKSRMVPAYSDFGLPGLWKNFPMVRPTLLVDQAPAYAMTVLLDFEFPNISPVLTPGAPLPAALWDVAEWDKAVWSATSTVIKNWVATAGGGYNAALQMDFDTPGGTRIITYDWWLTGGGPL
jgi:hypothetical protein